MSETVQMIFRPVLPYAMKINDEKEKTKYCIQSFDDVSEIPVNVQLQDPGSIRADLSVKRTFQDNDQVDYRNQKRRTCQTLMIRIDESDIRT